MDMLKLLIFLVSVGYVFGQAYFAPGPCPAGRQVGDHWGSGCVDCYCTKDGHGCTGCGLIAAFPGCTIKVDKNATHPDCCPKLDCPAMG